MGSVFDKLNSMNEQSEPHYVLMNKDREVCEFIIRGQGEMEECISIKGTADLPFYFGSIDTWVNSRSAAKHRRHIQDILESTGGTCPSGFIALTHCLSVNDTFWVRRKEECLSWSDINLYDNEFTDVISKVSFNGGGLFGEQFSVTSPELTTDGAFDKCWVRYDDGVYLIKAGSKGAVNAGMEPYSEALASQIFNALLPNDSVQYSLRRYHGKVISACKLFTSQDVSYLPYSTFIHSSERLPTMLRTFEEYGCGDMFRGMIIGDGISLNTDRHFNNFGWLCDTTNMRRTAMAPIFDFNMAMATYAYQEDFDNFDAWLNDSNHGPRIGDGYVSSAKAMLTPAFRAKLIDMKDLYLTIPCDDKFTEDRLRKMNIIKNVMIDRILGREAEFKF